ncbi:MAG: ATP-binding protein [Acidimicrobiia bacterium]|nr:ATP-binding protein [Acidimicrobiia bacterium]
MGRSRELTALDSAWQSTRRGHGSLQLLEGEPGIGKTRLLDEAFDHLTEDDALVIACSAGPRGPFLRDLESELEIERDAPAVLDRRRGRVGCGSSGCTQR